MIDVHAILAKLTAVATAALPNLQVLDGRTYGVDLADRVLIVGYAPNPDQLPVANVSRSVGDGGLDSTRYDVAVSCRLVVGDGEEEFVAKRSTTQGYMSALEAAIGANVRLDGTVYEAWVSPEQSWYQIATNEGNAVEVDFTITASVFA